MCVTALADARARKSAVGSSALERTIEPPPTQRAQENRQAAIAPHVVERAPHHRVFAAHGTGERRQIMHHEFRHAGRAGGEQDPLGGVACAPFGRSRREFLAARHDAQAERVMAGMIGDDRFGLGRRGNRGEVRRRHARRAKNHAPRNAVELDEDERRRELILRRQENRASAQRFERVPEARSGRKFGKPHAARRAAQEAGAAIPAVAFQRAPERARLSLRRLHST